MIRMILPLTLSLFVACVDQPDDPSEDTSDVSQDVTTSAYALWIKAPGGAADGINYGLIADNNTHDGVLNYAIQARNTSTALGQKFGMHVNASGPGGVNYGILAGAANGDQNIALQTNHGDVVLNAQAGSMRSNGNTTLGSTNANLRTAWGHESIRGTAPTLPCGAVVGSDTRGMAKISASSCTLTFSRTFSRAVSCIVTARDGMPVAYQVSPDALAFENVAGRTVDYSCVCVGGDSCK